MKIKTSDKIFNIFIQCGYIVITLIMVLACIITYIQFRDMPLKITNTICSDKTQTIKLTGEIT